MKTKIYGLLFSVAMIGLSVSTFAQHKNFEETIAYLNTKVGEDVKITSKKDMVTFTTKKNGSTYKIERVAVMDLNPGTIENKPEEGGVIMRCTGDPCIERKIPSKKVKGGYNRMIVEIPGEEKDVNGFINAMRHLIMVSRDENYKNDRPFE